MKKGKEMVLFKYRLPNGNILIWLGTGGIGGKSEGIDNVLVLDGGDVLFLKTTKVIPLNKQEVKEDIKNLSYEEFAKKYELPSNRELWQELKEGIEIGRYPPFRENHEKKVSGFRNMVSAYISNILQLKNQDEKIRQLEAIVGECYRKIQEIKAESSN
jgi:hypothetical protein